MTEQLNIDLLYPHPQNPRRDVGDISELTESIKANGVFQNLTVIKGGAGVPEGADGYTVIIGHRRLAASRAAGLTELPCSVVEMDEKEQVATMLLENMQRCDLTPYEQAQGFQMMLDLGETEAGIAEKTGFSKATVKHRIKLLELDKTEFEKAQEKGASLSDYIELEKINDPKLKNEALKKIGTDNFKWAVSSALRSEKRDAAHNAWKTLFKELKLKKGEESLISKKEDLMCSYINFDDLPSPQDKKKIISLVKNGKAKCYSLRQSWLYILGDDKPKGRKAKTAKEIALASKIKTIKQLEQQAKELREAFIKNYIGGHEDIIIRAAIEAQVSLYTWNDREKRQKEYLGIKEDTVKGSEHYAYLIKRHPEIVLFSYLALNYESDGYKIELVDVNGTFRRNPALEKWYETLTKLGYRISDEEIKLLDGTHECFKEE